MTTPPLEDNLFESTNSTQGSITDDELDEEAPQTPVPSPISTPNGSIANEKPS